MHGQEYVAWLSQDPRRSLSVSTNIALILVAAGATVSPRITRS